MNQSTVHPNTTDESCQ
uniref:Uncharacterized protein n=1 Tax=Anguilla anguilla TaxID=7936 RepID=A0A0E9U591_ANGAN